MKIKLLTLLLIIAVSAGCSTVPKNNSNDLRTVFDNYLSVAKNGSIAERSRYFTPAYWSGFDGASYDPVADIVNTDRIVGSWDKIEGDKGCLILEAVNKQTGHDTDYQIDFVRHNDYWLFDYVAATSYGESMRRDKDRHYFCEAIRKEKVDARQLGAGADM